MSVSTDFNSLFYVKTSDTETSITCALKEATLVHTSGEGQKIGKPLYAGQGPEGKNLTIRAEILYLQPGEYSFPSKEVTIIARRLATVAEGSVTLSVNGADGKNPEDAPSVRPINARRGGKGASGIHTSEGKKGEDGKDAQNTASKGDSGDKGGDIYLYLNEVDPNLTLKLTANGGDGKRGGNGGRGQNGGDGGKGGTATGTFDGYSPEPHNRQGGPSSKGGNGSDGKSGGDGGSGGNIYLRHKQGKIEAEAKGGAKGEKGHGGGWGEAGVPGAGGGPSRVTKIADDGVGGFRYAQVDLPQAPRGSYKLADGTVQHHGTWGKDGADGNEGKEGAVHFPNTFNFEKDLAVQFTPPFLSMILRRLEFFYLTEITAKPLDELTPEELKKKQSEIDSFKDTLEWLQDLVLHVEGENKKSIQDMLYQLNQLVHKIGSKRDYYNNPFNAIPQLNWDIKEFERFNDSFRQITLEFGTLESQYARYKDSLEQLQASYKRFTTKIAAAQRAAKEYETELARIGKTIEAKTTHSEKAREELEEKILSLEDKIEKLTSCTLKDIGDSIGMLLLFTAGEFNPATAIGGALTLAGAAEERDATVDLGPGGRVNRKYLTSSMQTISGDIGSIREGYTTIKEGYITEEDPNGGRLILEQQRFEQIYRDYLSQLEGEAGEAAEGVRGLFEKYINAVQERNRSIEEYNEIYAKYEGSVSTKENLEQQKAYLEGNQDKLNDHHNLDILFEYYSSAIHGVRLQMVYDVYSFCRAYRCLTLTESQALQNLSGLQSWDYLDALAMDTAYSTLTHELNDFKTTLGVHRRAEWCTTFSIGKEHQAFPSILEEMKTSSAFHFAFKVGDAPFQGKADVRFNDMEVYLKGIASKEGKEISFSIRPIGFYQIEDIHHNVFDFVLSGEGEQLDIPFAYSYADPSDPESYNRTTSQPSNAETKFVFGERGEGISYSLFSPYSKWQVKAITPLAPSSLEKFEEVILKFKVTYRNFAN